jgi:mono/diheme cytochrome c family protein
MWRALIASGLSLAAACAAPPPATSNPPLVGEAGSAGRGLAYARENCAACHGVEAGQMLSPLPQAPAFAELANTPGMTGTALHAWLRSPHEYMPHLLVDQDHVDDLWAYMSSLERRDQR